MMKRLTILGMLVAAFAIAPSYAAPAGDSEWDPKACMKRCLKAVKEDVEEKMKEGKLEKNDSKVKNGKVNMHEVKQTCESICQVNG